MGEYKLIWSWNRNTGKLPVYRVASEITETLSNNREEDYSCAISDPGVKRESCILWPFLEQCGIAQCIKWASLSSAQCSLANPDGIICVWTVQIVAINSRIAFSKNSAFCKLRGWTRQSNVLSLMHWPWNRGQALVNGGSLRKQKYIDTSYSVIYFSGHEQKVEAGNIANEIVDECNFILTDNLMV